ncbi:cupin-like domain-containing protein [Agrobacterium tumefaciens]|uniref:cupin-like domain-containing protein n=1 Tax=Agrobacterium tumefaciens TaxID=358 RepID=UPI00224427B5|nr:cupin-like domain-containing protein [Agrobacterium tumefaciens]MCW8060205.1 cupin-like domain-containing protein [Agrobacterium tumefaciens]
MPTQSIPRTANLSRDRFYKEFVEPGQPVVIEDAARNWPAVSKWSIEYLAKNAGDVEVDLRALDLSKWPGTFLQNGRSKLRDYILDLETPREEETNWPPLRLAEQPMSRIFPALVDDLGESRLGRCSPEDFSIMISAGTTAAMHYHPRSEAISYQIKGKRRFVLFPPSETRSLDPMPVEGPMANFSRRIIDEHEVSTLSEDAYDATITEGEAIFIPIHWWHTVFSSPTLSILAVDFFRYGHKKKPCNDVSERVRLLDEHCLRTISSEEASLRSTTDPDKCRETLERIISLARILDDPHLEQSYLHRGLSSLDKTDARHASWTERLLKLGAADRR